MHMWTNLENQAQGLKSYIPTVAVWNSAAIVTTYSTCMVKPGCSMWLLCTCTPEGYIYYIE